MRSPTVWKKWYGSTWLYHFTVLKIFQLFNEASSLRSAVKSIARSLVKEKYHLYPGANDTNAPVGTEPIKNYVRNRVNNELLSNMSFLKGPPDEHVSKYSRRMSQSLTLYRGMRHILLTLRSLQYAAPVSMTAPNTSLSFILGVSMRQFRCQLLSLLPQQ